jgi:hypothetical protein
MRMQPPRKLAAPSSAYVPSSMVCTPGYMSATKTPGRQNSHNSKVQQQRQRWWNNGSEARQGEEWRERRKLRQCSLL